MIYDVFGKLVAEYGGAATQGPGGVQYVQQDWQGSVRTITNNAGFVLSRTDHTAFGEKTGTGVGLRSSAQGFGIETPTKQGYGLTEKDDATGLNHTWFRKNENQAGRWTSPDPYNGSASIGDPQSFNRYSYVTNQPTNFVDPSGLLIIIARYYGCRIYETQDGRAAYWCEGVSYTFFDDTPSSDGGGTVGGGGGTSGDCLPGFPCIKKIMAEGAELWKEREKCLQNARNVADKELAELRNRFPFDGTWASQVAVAAGAGAYYGKSGGPWAAAGAGAIGGGVAAYPRVSERVSGWYKINWKWTKALEDCGVPKNRAYKLPKRLQFPY